MAYRLKRRETVSESARRIAREELKVVVNQLRHNANRDAAVHEARKSVKKARALLRLIEPHMGARYQRESRVLREAGGALSELRDSGAVIETFDSLRKQYPEKLRGPKIAAARRSLVEAKPEPDPEVLSKIANAAEAMRKRVNKWSVQEKGFQAIGPGFKKSLRAARQAFEVAEKHPSPENYHEWRKRIKDHWYHVRLVESLWSDVLRGYEKSLEDIETRLGDDHNLSLLRARQSDVKILHAIEEYQKELRDSAVSLGKMVHQEKPSDFIQRMRELWKNWKA